MDEVGNEQQPAGALGEALPGMGMELEDRIEVEELDAGAGEDLLSGNSIEDPRGNAGGPLVAVADRVLHQAPVRVDQPVVDPPAIDPHALYRPAELPRPLAGPAKPRVDLGEDVGRIPAQVPGRPAGRVVETAGLLEPHLAGADPGQEHPPAPRPQIDRDVKGLTHSARSTECSARGAEHLLRRLAEDSLRGETLDDEVRGAERAASR